MYGIASEHNFDLIRTSREQFQSAAAALDIRSVASLSFRLLKNVQLLELRAKLNLFIRPEYEKTRRMTGFEFLSNIGGLLVFVVFFGPTATFIAGLCGLCLGFSLLSGVEILYWIIIRIVRNVMLLHI